MCQRVYSEIKYHLGKEITHNDTMRQKRKEIETDYQEQSEANLKRKYITRVYLSFSMI